MNEMLESLANDIGSSDEKRGLIALKKFNEKNATVFSFECAIPDVKSSIWSNLFNLLHSVQAVDSKTTCLSSVRILSRDPNLLKDPDFADKYLVQLVELSKSSDQRADTLSISVEAVKCLCNILKNSNSVRNIFSSINGIDPVLKRLESDKAYPPDLKLFDMRLLFLISALNVSFRGKFYNEHNGLFMLVKFLHNLTEDSNRIKRAISTFSETEILIMSEVLKILFNLLNSCTVSGADKNLEELCKYLKEILLLPSTQGTTSYRLQIDVVNLTTVLPLDCCSQLILPIDLSLNDVAIDEPLMAPAKTILNILDFTLTDYEAKTGTSQEMISPILMALLNLSKSHRLFRKYFRKLVLPHLRDVYRRPEEGNTLRNKLCRLLTSPVTSISDLAASWLFVLCKEKVSRMVKYTGYGNAAGLFARHGFPTVPAEYSSDSDSDTEEYLSNKEEINPVVGCKMIRPQEPAMTEEQKEHFAMELVKSVDRLQRGGFIQPCTIGDDGKPRPIEHVLQLQSDKNVISDAMEED